jgi:hypothetical protein
MSTRGCARSASRTPASSRERNQPLASRVLSQHSVVHEKKITGPPAPSEKYGRPQLDRANPPSARKKPLDLVPLQSYRQIRLHRQKKKALNLFAAEWSQTASGPATCRTSLLQQKRGYFEMKMGIVEI